MRKRLTAAIDNCRALVKALDDPARGYVATALIVLEGTRDDWADTDDNVLRTWLSCAKDDLGAALRVIDGRLSR